VGVGWLGVRLRGDGRAPSRRSWLRGRVMAALLMAFTAAGQPDCQGQCGQLQLRPESLANQPHCNEMTGNTGQVYY
jgi:hypothetical protein